MQALKISLHYKFLDFYCNDEKIVLKSKKNLYLFQPQFTSKINNSLQCWIPYSVGTIWAYASQFEIISSNWDLRDIIFRREKIEDVLSRLDNPALCAFSCYVWNERYTLALAEKIKQKWPACIIAIGGPNVNGTFTKYKFIDTIVHGGGEECFKQILEDVTNNVTPELFYNTKKVHDLHTMPSPYTTGVFNNIIKNNPDIGWSVVLETNRGCPYKCTFCDWGGLTSSKIKKFDIEKVFDEITWMKDKNIKTIFLSDANFGVFKERDIAIARKIKEELEDSTLEYLSATYPKNCNESIFAIAEALGKINKGITFSVQSMNPATLAAIKRDNMASNNLKSLFEMSNSRGIHHYTEMILGLPEETAESWKNGICEILTLGQHSRLDIHLCNILPNTELGDIQKKQYQIETIDVTQKQQYEFEEMSLTEEDIDEISPVVTSTNTMPRNDMIDAWMFSWIILHFHFSGYSQLLSKYAHHVKNISYREYYDRLHDKVKNGSDKFNTEYNRIKSGLANVFEYGETFDATLKTNNLTSQSLLFFYQNIEEAINLSQAVLEEMIDVDDTSIIELQRRFIQNNIWEIPYELDSNININTWESGPIRYKITNKINNFKFNVFDFYTVHRRNGGLKTNIEII